MNDLVEILRAVASSEEPVPEIMLVDLIEEAADAIEQLTRERDEARDECSVFMASNAGLTNDVLEVRAERNEAIQANEAKDRYIKELEIQLDRYRQALWSIEQWTLANREEPDLGKNYAFRAIAEIALNALGVEYY